MKLKEKIKKTKKYKQFAEKHENLITIWNNPRYHATIVLGLWLIPIAILAIIVRTNPTQPILSENKVDEKQELKEISIKDKLKQIDSYETTMTIEKYDSIEIIDKTYKNNEQLIKYANNIFYYKDNLYIVINNELIIDNNELLTNINYFNVNNIYNLIENVEEEYITKYQDGTFLINYKITLQELMQKYKNIIIDNQEYIDITLEGKENINKIKINLTNLNIVDINNNIKTIQLELRNINNIETINVNGIN